MKKRYLSVVSLLICFLFLFSACSDIFTSDIIENIMNEDTPEERRTVSFNDMVYTRPDIDAVKADIIRLTQELQEAKDFTEVKKLDDECSDLIASFDTQNSLAFIHRDLDTTDAFYEEELRILNEASVDIYLLYNDFLTVLVEGPFAEEYRDYIGDFSFKATETSLLFTLDSITDLQKRREELEIDYMDNIDNLTVSLDGEEYTYDDIYRLESFTQILQLQNEYYAQYSDVFAELYAELVAIDKEIAFTLGFTDAASMYYAYNSRDYTPADAMDIFENVKDYFVPLLEEIPYPQANDEIYFDDAIAQIPTALSNLDPSFAQIWQEMLDYELYDIAYSDTKSSNAYTVTIPDYDAAFVYTNWSDDFYSFSTVIHEFGHFLDDYSNYDDSFVFNLDMKETYSTTLELLFQNEYDMFYDDHGGIRLYQLYSFAMNTIVYQSLIEEFQMRVYELDSFDATVLGRTFNELMVEYGLGGSSFTDASGANHDWLSIPHIFSSPFYTISYVTSGGAALQLYQLSLEDKNAAIDAYSQLLEADQNQTYTDFLATVDLLPVTDKRVFQNAAGMYRKIFGMNVSYPTSDDSILQDAA